MTLDKIFKSIDNYLASDAHAPRLVDLSTRSDEMDFMGQFGVPGNKIVWAHEFCNDDMLPSYDKMMDITANSGTNIILFGISTFLKLEGQEKLVKVFKTLTELEPKGKLVIVSLGCGTYFKKNFDKRLFDSSRILIFDNEDAEAAVKFEFVERKLSADFGAIYDGINKTDIGAERSGDDQIVVRTNHKKRDFPNSLIDITECNSTYDLLVQSYSDLKVLPKELGTDNEWDYLYRQVRDCDGFSKYVDHNFGGIQNLPHSMLTFQDYDDHKKWGLFVALKLYGATDFEYLSEVVSVSATIKDFCYNFYALILNKDRKRKDFGKIYRERRELLKAMCNDTQIVSSFCKQVIGKEADAIYYLTNLSQQEEEQIIWTISHYANSYEREKLLKVLEMVYPQLAAYLYRFDYKSELLNKYFDEYKYCKVTNAISNTLLSLVNEQAKERDYNKLQPRATYVDQLEIDEHCAAFFVDALGIEYLAYLQHLCHANGLLLTVNIGRCDLPSVTEYNKDFLAPFNDKGINVISNKKIDDMMHEGVTKYDYEKVKEPIHISAQLTALDILINNVKVKLYNGITDRVYLLSDHGATRMAVINDNAYTYDFEGKGEHGGRCCPKPQSGVKPEVAAEESGYWCLANYDRFKGGRMSGVELHGGATLEEVCVPIIMVTRKDDTIDCEVTEESKVITVSFKKKAQIRLFISKELDNVSIRIENGDAHQPFDIKDKYYYGFDIPEVKRAGVYHLDVYAGDNIIATGLTFEVKKEGASERKFF